MPRMLVASSPVEIETKVEEAGLSRHVHDVARRMFHDLTDALGRAAIVLNLPDKDWPNHRFYFGSVGGEMAALLSGLRARADMVDVTNGAPARQAETAGLYIQQTQDSLVGILVAHQNHEGYLSSK
jgi:hypothetical protein